MLVQKPEQAGLLSHSPIIVQDAPQKC